MRPFKKSHQRPTKDNHQGNRRSIRQLKVNKAVKLCESFGVKDSKKTLRSALLNVDGLDEVSLEDVKSTVSRKKPDVVLLLETKRRLETCDIDANIPGYSLFIFERTFF